MTHTLLTFTPLQDSKEDTRDVLNCVALTQTLGPIPLASIDTNGWVVWEQKVVLVEGHLIQMAPVVGDRVMPPTHCFDIQSRQQAVKLTITKDTQNPLLYYIQFDPVGNIPVSTLNNTIRLSNNPTQNQPVPALQIISVRDKYLTAAQTLSLDFIGTTDTRMRSVSKMNFGNIVTVWAESNAVLAEWPAS